MERGDNWSKDECIVALQLYLQIKDGSGNYRARDLTEALKTPEYTALAVRRHAEYNSSSIKKKLENFKFHNEEYRGDGLPNGGLMTKWVWDEYHDKPRKLREAAETSRRILEFQNETPKEVLEGMLKLDPVSRAWGKDWISKTYPMIVVDNEDFNKPMIESVRIGQAMFRRDVLNNFEGRCCITGMSGMDILHAGHIRPWSECNDFQKVDCANGLCLEPLMDCAFDRGYICIDGDLEVRLSDRLVETIDDNTFKTRFQPYEGERIADPVNEKIEIGYLNYHREHVFKT